KTRIRDLARQLMPTAGQAMSRQLSRTDLEILRAWGDPRTLVAQGLEALTAFVVDVSQTMYGRAKAEAWLAAAEEAMALYGDSFASFTGLVPRASETGETDRKGQAMTKAGNRKLRRMLYRAADTARKEDPQLARIYCVQMVERGATHTKALAVVAAHLARR